MVKGGAVYILTNTHKTTLYIGVTSDLKSRLIMHLNKHFKNSFTARYNLTRLVYFEIFSTIEEAILREKQLKRKKRINKEKLISNKNPEWLDLSEEVFSW